MHFRFFSRVKSMFRVYLINSQAILILLIPFFHKSSGTRTEYTNSCFKHLMPSLKSMHLNKLIQKHTILGKIFINVLSENKIIQEPGQKPKLVHLSLEKHVRHYCTKLQKNVTSLKVAKLTSLNLSILVFLKVS